MWSASVRAEGRRQPRRLGQCLGQGRCAGHGMQSLQQRGSREHGSESSGNQGGGECIRQTVHNASAPPGRSVPCGAVHAVASGLKSSVCGSTCWDSALDSGWSHPRRRRCRHARAQAWAGHIRLSSRGRGKVQPLRQGFKTRKIQLFSRKHAPSRRSRCACMCQADELMRTGLHGPASCYT